MRKYFYQRTTLVGSLVIGVALLGAYGNFLDEGSTILLMIFGFGGIIPENWPITRKIFTFIAPILVHKIKQQSSSSKNKNISFEQAPFQGAFSLEKQTPTQRESKKLQSFFKFPKGILGFAPTPFLNSFLKENLMDETQTLLTTPASSTESPTQTPSVMNIEAQIEQIIINALGSKLTPSEQSKLHTIGTFLGEVMRVLLPLASGKIDIDGLKAGLFALNASFLQEEAALKQIRSALQKQ